MTGKDVEGADNNMLQGGGTLRLHPGHRGPTTADEYIERFKQILHSEGGPGKVRWRKKDADDWLGYFNEWIHSDVLEYPNCKVFALAKGFHPNSYQQHGGRLFWNQAREDVRVLAMMNVIVKAPERVEAAILQTLEVGHKCMRAADAIADGVLLDVVANETPTGDGKKDEQARRDRLDYNTGLLARLQQIHQAMAETNQALKGVSSVPPTPNGVSIFNIFKQELAERNERYGVKDTGNTTT